MALKPLLRDILFVSLFCIVPPFVDNNLHLVIIAVLVAVLLSKRSFSIQLPFRSYLFIFSILITVPLFSLYFGHAFYLVIGKSVKIFLYLMLLLLPLPLLFPKRLFFIYFIPINLICFFAFPGDVNDVGLFGSVRFYGVHMDPNIFAINTAMLLIYFKSPMKMHFLNMLLSQSVTTLAGFTIAHFLKTRFLLVLLLISACFLCVLWFSSTISYDVLSWVNERIFSFSRRLEGLKSYLVMISGFDFVSYIFALFVGIGSGRSGLYSETVLHSFYAQSFADHGLIYLSVFLYLFYKFLKNNIISWRFCIFCGVIFLALDPVHSGSVFFILYMKLCDNLMLNKVEKKNSEYAG